MLLVSNELWEREPLQESKGFFILALTPLAEAGTVSKYPYISTQVRQPMEVWMHLLQSFWMLKQQHFRKGHLLRCA